jgi:hypothetical protein
MQPNTQAHVNAMLATIRGTTATDVDENNDAWIEAYDMAEALFVFAHDAGEYELFNVVMQLPFRGHVFLATGDDRGLTDEGLVLYRELLKMEGLS